MIKGASLSSKETSFAISPPEILGIEDDILVYLIYTQPLQESVRIKINPKAVPQATLIYFIG